MEIEEGFIIEEQVRENVLELLEERGQHGYEISSLARVYGATYGVTVHPDQLGLRSWKDLLGKFNGDVEVEGPVARMREDASPVTSGRSSSCVVHTSEEETELVTSGHRERVKQPDILGIQATKPQNFDAARTCLKVLDGYKLCTAGCGTQIAVGNKNSSMVKWPQNENNLDHQKICGKRISYDSWKNDLLGQMERLPKDEPTPATYDRRRRRKTDLGFQYGTGAFVLPESQSKKERRKKEKLNKKAEGKD